MNIQDWFDNSGNFKDGVELYKQLPNHSKIYLRAFRVENLSNFLTLKYELKKALLSGSNISLESKEIPIIPEIPKIPVQDPEPSLDYLIKQSESVSFKKETMAMYPPELHPVYRERVSNFYLACELKFKLNALKPKENEAALDLILKLEDLWSKIDKAWMVLEYWKDNNRLMPTEPSTDYSKMNGMQLAKQIALLDSRISKRKKTLAGLESALESDPGNRLIANQYKLKKEALEQLIIDLETIKKLFKDE